MLTLRDKLLIRPWQQRKYENHRRKVQSALPAIDNRPPASRSHVSVKLKKKQKETERIVRIEKENLILLKKMSSIMRTSRVDNTWITPLPNFLNRVSIYDSFKNQDDDIYVDVEMPPIKCDSGGHIRKGRCRACTPQKIRAPSIPEDRVPWEPERPTRRRAKSVPATKTSLPTIIERDDDEATIKAPGATRSAGFKRSNKTVYEDCSKSPHSIVLSRGCLRLAVNFPSDAVVKLNGGSSERLLFGGECFCKNLAKVF